MKSLEGVPQWPRTRDSSLFWVASTSGRSSEALSRWTPSESITVPSVKTCSNMPNWLPSFDRPRATRVKSGSAVVTALLTRGRGLRRGWPSCVPERSGVDGPSDETGPSPVVGFGMRDAALPGGKNEPPLPMSPKADEGAWLPGNPDWPALVEFSDGVDDVDDDEELPTSRKSRPKKLVSSAWADPGWNARTSNPGTTRAPTTLENTPRIADLLAGSLRLGPGFLGTDGLSPPSTP